MTCRQARDVTPRFRTSAYFRKLARMVYFRSPAEPGARGQVLPLDDRDGQGVAAIGVVHQPIVGCGGSGRRKVGGGKRQDLTPH